MLRVLEFPIEEVNLPIVPMAEAAENFAERYPEVFETHQRLGMAANMMATFPDIYHNRRFAFPDVSHFGWHCVGTAQCAQVICSILGLGEEQTSDIVRAAYAHGVKKPFAHMYRKLWERGFKRHISLDKGHFEILPFTEEFHADLLSVLQEFVGEKFKDNKNCLFLSEKNFKIIKNAGTCTRQSNLHSFWQAHEGDLCMKDKMLEDKIVFLADAMSRTDGSTKTVRFMEPASRVRDPGFHEYYPFLWKRGYIITQSGDWEFCLSKPQNLEEGTDFRLMVHLRLMTANLICLEFQRRVDPDSENSIAAKYWMRMKINDQFSDYYL